MRGSSGFARSLTPGSRYFFRDVTVFFTRAPLRVFNAPHASLEAFSGVATPFRPLLLEVLLSR